VLGELASFRQHQSPPGRARAARASSRGPRQRSRVRSRAWAGRREVRPRVWRCRGELMVAVLGVLLPAAKAMANGHWCGLQQLRAAPKRERKRAEGDGDAPATRELCSMTPMAGAVVAMARPTFTCGERWCS
jgi:hypothetical protein